MASFSIDDLVVVKDIGDYTDVAEREGDIFDLGCLICQMQRLVARQYAISNSLIALDLFDFYTAMILLK